MAKTWQRTEFAPSRDLPPSRAKRKPPSLLTGTAAHRPSPRDPPPAAVKRRYVPDHDAEPDGKGLLANPNHCRGRGPGLLLPAPDLRLTCACGRITDYPFTLLLQRQGVTRESFIGNIRFRCKNCGGKEIKIGARSQAPPLTP
jgi:hypothetical protein